MSPDINMQRSIGVIEGRLMAVTEQLARIEAHLVAVDLAIKSVEDDVSILRGALTGGWKMLAAVGSIAAAIGATLSSLLAKVFHG